LNYGREGLGVLGADELTDETTALRSEYFPKIDCWTADGDAALVPVFFTITVNFVRLSTIGFETFNNCFANSKDWRGVSILPPFSILSLFKACCAFNGEKDEFTPSVVAKARRAECD
jgi:hypothetical protein